MNTTELIQGMLELTRQQHKTLATEDSYVHWLRSYPAVLRDIPNALSNGWNLEKYLTELALKRVVAAGTQNQSSNVIVFFYKEVLGTPLHDVDAIRATLPIYLRHAPI